MIPPEEAGMSLGGEENCSGGWVSRQVEAMIAAWGNGTEITAREVLDGRAEVDSESAIRLIYEETCLRREAGQQLGTAEVLARYPRWASELQALFECDRLIRSPRGIAHFPELGEMLGPFLLLEELGRGNSGRTFLASDPTLADRTVVLKVIPDDQDEHLALARLQHTHIVPLFSEHMFPERGLRVLCMPFLGGTSLACILHDLAGVPPEQRSGKLLVKLLDRHTRGVLCTPRAEGPFRAGLEQASYVEAMTWLTSCLADALQYSHARGLVHMDIKPSNVLITMDGQPMLLDFHLARRPILAGERGIDRLGGTPGWMSLEQEQALNAMADGRPIPLAVDGRSDIFALGLLLGEAIGAVTSSPDRVNSRLRVNRPEWVSIGLVEILKKCLAPKATGRYDDPAALAEDLRRELNDLPLRGARNRSLRERFRKWRRRHPGILAWGVVGLLVSAALGVALAASIAFYRQRVEQIRLLLEDGRKGRADGRFAEAVRALERGLEFSGAFFVPANLRESLRAELRLAERARLAESLHVLADLIRSSHGNELPSRAEGQSLLRLCRAVWEHRDQLLQARDQLSEEPEQTIRTDLLELAAIGADLMVRQAPADGIAAARANALRLLNEAEAICGASFALDVRRDEFAVPPEQYLARASGRVPRSAWEYYELGRYNLRIGRVEEAAIAFQSSLDMRPHDFWPNFYHGLCSFRLHRFDEAVAGFRACLAIEPGSAVAHYNRALAYDAKGCIQDAYRGYSKAIELAPSLLAARLNRGILSYKTGRFTEAVADFDRGLEAGPDREMSGRFRFNLALAELGLGDRTRARVNAKKSVDLGCTEAAPLVDELR
jgi:serine/threonine protein kinase/tetratricopeptide (TPR) repeat protein